MQHDHENNIGKAKNALSSRTFGSGFRSELCFVIVETILLSWASYILITMIINKLLVRQINIHGVNRYNIFSLTELLYFSALGKAVRLGRGAVQDDEWCTGAPHDGAPHVNVVRVENTRR